MEGSSHGKGYGSKIAKQGSDWISTNRDKYGNVSWNALNENIVSKSLAEKSGWKKTKTTNKWTNYSF